MDYIFVLAVCLSFLITLVVLPFWIKKARDVGLVWEDMNRINHPKTGAASGGIVVVMSFVISVLFYIFLKTFLFKGTIHGLEIFALIGVVLLFTLIGLVDDLLGWKHGGLSVRSRIFLALVASIPLVVVNAGESVIGLPFLGNIDLGILYPLIFIPLAVGFVATTYNMLAGFSGLEAGQGILILSFLSFVAFVTGSAWLSIVGLCMVASLMVFLFYNWNPLRVFPGDILTYSVGALIIGMAILGNFEKMVLIVFIPYLIEVVLKLRGKLNKQSFGIPQKDGGVTLPYDKIYGLTHLSILILSKFKTKVRIEDVVCLIFAFQIIMILIAFAVTFL